MHQLDQPLFGAHLEEVFVQLEAGVVLFVFLPPQVILLLRAEGAILQSFGIIARENELNGAEKGRVELRLLVGNILADAVTDRDAAVLQLQHPDGDAVHIHHISGRRSRLPKSVTSSAMAKSFFSGSAQLIKWTVSVTLPASIFTGTP